MDHGTKRELDSLLREYRDALEEIGRASDDAGRVSGWRKVLTLGWRLHELLAPGIERRSA
jgi:hypothetical protein